MTVKAYFVNAEKTRPKDESKPQRVIINALFDDQSTSNKTAGYLKTIWCPAESTASIWALLSECQFGDVVEFEQVIRRNGNREYVDYFPVSVG
ncbi:MAG: hypothetical protein QXI16_02180 [Sulfolobaceae archaeon]